jgi:hypothetical protein
MRSFHINSFGGPANLIIKESEIPQSSTVATAML